MSLRPQITQSMRKIATIGGLPLDIGCRLFDNEAFHCCTKADHLDSLTLPLHLMVRGSLTATLHFRYEYNMVARLNACVHPFLP